MMIYLPLLSDPNTFDLILTHARQALLLIRARLSEQALLLLSYISSPSCHLFDLNKYQHYNNTLCNHIASVNMLQP